MKVYACFHNSWSGDGNSWSELQELFDSEEKAIAWYLENKHKEWESDTGFEGESLDYKVIEVK